jgi:NTP pyrophosphatase (non-canonical NTP hydrolase)
MMKPWQKYIYEAIRTLQHAVHKNAQEHGWYEGPTRTDGELIALEHSELSEALDSLRNGNKESEKIPGFSHAEEEFADVVIRIADHCEYRGWNLAGAILAKHEFNKSRPHRHGGKLF